MHQTFIFESFSIAESEMQMSCFWRSTHTASVVVFKLKSSPPPQIVISSSSATHPDNLRRWASGQGFYSCLNLHPNVSDSDGFIFTKRRNVTFLHRAYMTRHGPILSGEKRKHYAHGYRKHTCEICFMDPSDIQLHLEKIKNSGSLYNQSESNLRLEM